jgi:uncharacterized membrane protein
MTHEHSHGHADDHAAASAAGAATWMIALVFTMIVAAILVIALFIWVPWDNDNNGSGTTGGENAPAEQADDDINIDGDIDIE